MHLPSVTPSERSFTPQTVCVWMSGVFAARALLGDRVAATYDEVIALARDSGVPGDDWKKVGQANFTKLAAGMKKRYGLGGQVIEGSTAAQAAIRAQAAAGPIVACLAGNQLNLTPHWQQGSIGHAIAVLYEHGTTGLQFDPLAPAGYAGDPFPPEELAKFTSAALIFKEEAPVTDMPQLKTYAPALISLGGAPLVGGNVPIHEAPSSTGPLAYALAPGRGFLTAIGTVGTAADEWYVYWDLPKGKWLYVRLSNVPIRKPLVEATGGHSDVELADARAQGAEEGAAAVAASAATRAAQFGTKKT